MRISDWSSDVCSSDLSLYDLTVAEDAYIAALPKAPSNYNPVRHHHRAKARRDWVKIRRASRRERVGENVEISVGAGQLTQQNSETNMTLYVYLHIIDTNSKSISCLQPLNFIHM